MLENSRVLDRASDYDSRVVHSTWAGWGANLLPPCCFDLERWRDGWQLTESHPLVSYLELPFHISLEGEVLLSALKLLETHDFRVDTVRGTLQEMSGVNDSMDTQGRLKDYIWTLCFLPPYSPLPLHWLFQDVMLPPQGLCTCYSLCLECSSSTSHPDNHIYRCLTSFMSLLKSHVLSKVSSSHLI